MNRSEIAKKVVSRLLPGLAVAALGSGVVRHCDPPWANTDVEVAGPESMLVIKPQKTLVVPFDVAGKGHPTVQVDYSPEGLPKSERIGGYPHFSAEVREYPWWRRLFGSEYKAVVRLAQQENRAEKDRYLPQGRYRITISAYGPKTMDFEVVEAVIDLTGPEIVDQATAQNGRMMISMNVFDVTSVKGVRAKFPQKNGPGEKDIKLDPEGRGLLEFTPPNIGIQEIRLTAVDGVGHQTVVIRKYPYDPFRFIKIREFQQTVLKNGKPGVILRGRLNNGQNIKEKTIKVSGRRSRIYPPPFNRFDCSPVEKNEGGEEFQVICPLEEDKVAIIISGTDVNGYQGKKEIMIEMPPMSWEKKTALVLAWLGSVSGLSGLIISLAKRKKIERQFRSKEGKGLLKRGRQ